MKIEQPNMAELEAEMLRIIAETGWQGAQAK